jgi:hypothetical protein
MYVYTYIHTYIHTYNIYVCVCVYIYIRIYTHTYVRILFIQSLKREKKSNKMVTKRVTIIQFQF